MEDQGRRVGSAVEQVCDGGVELVGFNVGVEADPRLRVAHGTRQRQDKSQIKNIYPLI